MSRIFTIYALIFLIVAVFFYAARLQHSIAINNATRETSTAPAQMPAVAQAVPSDWRSFKKPDDATLRSELTPLQYEVTQKDGTEPPFHNDYWNAEGKEGIYVDIVSGEPLFSSEDMYDSGTGWPSFTKPLVADNIVEKTDYSLIIPRTEVRSKHADSHLGHVFTDGPQPLGLRYCMNSAAMRFIPKADLVADGYGEFASLFQ